jgi:hypothetical protein
LDPRDPLKDAVHSLIAVVMFLTLFVLVLPVLIKTLDGPAGKAVYGVFAAVAVAAAFRLRQIARRM